MLFHAETQKTQKLTSKSSLNNQQGCKNKHVQQKCPGKTTLSDVDDRTLKPHFNNTALSNKSYDNLQEKSS